MPHRTLAEIYERHQEWPESVKRGIARHLLSTRPGT
jgi:hypothetical protein